MRFDFSDLQLLIHIADSGSITANAQLAGLSLAAASARVQGMELARNSSCMHGEMDFWPARREVRVSNDRRDVLAAFNDRGRDRIKFDLRNTESERTDTIFDARIVVQPCSSRGIGPLKP
jgi:hypothetical protein